MRSIIAITGLSGSGKTTIGDIIKYRFKDVIVVDTDVIDDHSFFQLFENNASFKEMIKSNTKEQQKLHRDMNIKERDAIITNNPTKNIVFVGMTIPMDGIEHIGYFLDVSIETNFRQINKRTLYDITKNSSQLEKLFSDEDVEYINSLTLYKFKIRQRFPIDIHDVRHHSSAMKEKFSKKKYKIMTGQEILSDLKTYLSSSTKISSFFIIHVSGSQGSGKSYMGDKLQLYFGDIIHVKDLDNLAHDFSLTDSTNSTNYQEFIDDYITKHSDKPIVFVGLDAEMCLGTQDSSDTRFKDLHADHKFFIDLGSDSDLLKQRFYRQIQKLADRKEFLFQEWQKNPKTIQDKLIRYIDISFMAKK